MATNSNSGALVVGPDESPSYWQPVPANGYAEVRVSTNHANGSAFSSGIQCIAPGGHIREHWHDHNEELLFIYQGTGSAVVTLTPAEDTAGDLEYDEDDPEFYKGDREVLDFYDQPEMGALEEADGH